MSNYGTLQSEVQDWMGRSDIPSSVYRLANEDVNRDLRLLEMTAETTLAAAESVSLPSDFLEVETLYIDYNDTRFVVSPLTEQAGQTSGQGAPAYFSVHDGELTLMPAPDASYTLTLRYYAKLADFSADSDTNAILSDFYGVYLYAALTHAAIWAKDTASAQDYAAVYAGRIERLTKTDVKRRVGPTMFPRIRRAF